MAISRDDPPSKGDNPLVEHFSFNPLVMFFHHGCGGRIFEPGLLHRYIDPAKCHRDSDSRLVLSLCMCDKCAKSGVARHVLKRRWDKPGQYLSDEQQDKVTREWVKNNPGFSVVRVICGHVEFDDPRDLM